MAKKKKPINLMPKEAKVLLLETSKKIMRSSFQKWQVRKEVTSKTTLEKWWSFKNNPFIWFRSGIINWCLLQLYGNRRLFIICSEKKKKWILGWLFAVVACYHLKLKFQFHHLQYYYNMCYLKLQTLQHSASWLIVTSWFSNH